MNTRGGGGRGGLSCTHAGMEIHAGGGWRSLTVHLQHGPNGLGEVCGFLGERCHRPDGLLVAGGEDLGRCTHLHFSGTGGGGRQER